VATKDSTRTPARNGDLSRAPVKLEPSQEQLAEAADHERQIEFEAGKVWEEREGERPDGMTRELFRKLRPLLRKPIPEGYISEVTAGKGKPYPSKGIKSLQVQIDRLDNVLGETHWSWTTEYLNDAGTLAEVTVSVLDFSGKEIFSRKARGGVDRGSTTGNTHKGTETNAAKLAFARLGVGHEVYIGLTDLDPDVDEEAAQAQAEGGKTASEPDPSRPLPADKVEPLRKAVEDAGLSEHLDMKLRSFGVDQIEKLSVEQALGLWAWAKGEAQDG
jgi:hypothetical protein